MPDPEATQAKLQAPRSVRSVAKRTAFAAALAALAGVLILMGLSITLKWTGGASIGTWSTPMFTLHQGRLASLDITAESGDFTGFGLMIERSNLAGLDLWPVRREGSQRTYAVWLIALPFAALALWVRPRARKARPSTRTHRKVLARASFWTASTLSSIMLLLTLGSIGVSTRISVHPENTSTYYSAVLDAGMLQLVEGNWLWSVLIADSTLNPQPARMNITGVFGYRGFHFTPILEWPTTFALWPLAVISLIPVYLTRPRRLKPGQCTACGYTLTGLTGQTCPECGRSTNQVNDPAAACAPS